LIAAEEHRRRLRSCIDPLIAGKQTRVVIRQPYEMSSVSASSSWPRSWLPTSVALFLRAPAEGRWHDSGSTEHDDIVVIEVMASTFDRAWWTAMKTTLEHRFNQDVVIRAHEVEVL
jgi:hypothetical protein